MIITITLKKQSFQYPPPFTKIFWFEKKKRPPECHQKPNHSGGREMAGGHDGSPLYYLLGGDETTSPQTQLWVLFLEGQLEKHV